MVEANRLWLFDICANNSFLIWQRNACVWGARHPTEYYAGRGPHRKVLGEVVNGVRGRQVQTICVACGVALCADRSCFHKWHAHLHRNN